MLSHRGHYFSSARTWMPAERLSCDLKAERLLDHPLLVASREEIEEGASRGPPTVHQFQAVPWDDDAQEIRHVGKQEV